MVQRARRVLNVLVLCGGRSAERDVSCVSAAAIIRNLSKSHKALLVWIDPKGRWFYQKDPAAFANKPKPWTYAFGKTPARLDPGMARLQAGAKALGVDVVFPALHGPFGEDGTVQGLLELAGLPYVGCGVLGSAVGMDKVVLKRLAREAGLPVLPYAVLTTPSQIALAKGLRYPLFVKPSRLGSSVGVYKVKKPAELRSAVKKAFRYDTVVLIEQGVPAREIECAVLGAPGAAKASIAGEIRPNAEFYSYHAKYIDPNGAQLLIPAQISPSSLESTRKLAVKAFEALDCYGLARVDFFMDSRNGKLWFNEVNTLPGFTSISMYPKMWAASGLPFTKLIDRLLDLAVRRHKKAARLRITRD